MKRWLTLVVTAGFVVGGLSLFTPLSAHGQAGPLEMVREMHHRPGHFHLFDENEAKVVDFKTDHTVQICVEQRAHKIPLLVN